MEFNMSVSYILTYIVYIYNIYIYIYIYIYIINYLLFNFLFIGTTTN